MQTLPEDKWEVGKWRNMLLLQYKKETNKQQICPASIPCLRQQGLSEVKPCSSTQPHLLFQAVLWTAVCQNASLIGDGFWRGTRRGRGRGVDDLKNSSLKTAFLKVHIKSDRGHQKHSHLQFGLCWCRVCGMNIRKETWTFNAIDSYARKYSNVLL